MEMFGHTRPFSYTIEKGNEVLYRMFIEHQFFYNQMKPLRGNNSESKVGRFYFF